MNEKFILAVKNPVMNWSTKRSFVGHHNAGGSFWGWYLFLKSPKMTF